MKAPSEEEKAIASRLTKLRKERDSLQEALETVYVRVELNKALLSLVRKGS